MIAKRWMADREVLKVKALFPAAVAQQVRTGFHLPEGPTMIKSMTALKRGIVFMYMFP